MSEEGEQILVVGVGNLLMADEGIGVHAAQGLQRLSWPPQVHIMECGTNLMAIAPHLQGVRKLIIVDAVRTGGRAGTIYRFTYEEIERAPAGLRFAHQVNLLSSLRLLRAAEQGFASTEIVLLGVEPKVIQPSLRLSAEVKAALPALIEAVRAEVQRQS